MIKSKRWKYRLCLQYDNWPNKTSKIVKDHNEHSCVKIWDHPPYSTDLAKCDYCLFGTMKLSFNGCDIKDENELIDSI